MLETVAPGKHRVIALKKRTDLMIESPIIRVDGGNKGGMKGDCEGLAADGPALQHT